MDSAIAVAWSLGEVAEARIGKDLLRSSPTGRLKPRPGGAISSRWSPITDQSVHVSAASWASDMPDGRTVARIGDQRHLSCLTRRHRARRQHRRWRSSGRLAAPNRTPPDDLAAMWPWRVGWGEQALQRTRRGGNWPNLRPAS